MAHYQCNGWYITNESPYFPLPDSKSSKQSLIDGFVRSHKKVRAEGYSTRGFKWARYFTGYEAGCGELYVIGKEYASRIGYGGPVTYKDEDIIMANAKYFGYANTDSDLTVLPKYKVKRTGRKN